MLWNNLAMIGAWTAMAWLVGPMLFLACAVASLSLAGGVGILLFTVQHNFEHSYASRNQDWDYLAAVLAGTSFLELPRWLNWFTANIAYHHIHHLSKMSLVWFNREGDSDFTVLSRFYFSVKVGSRF